MVAVIVVVLTWPAVFEVSMVVSNIQKRYLIVIMPYHTQMNSSTSGSTGTLGVMGRVRCIADVWCTGESEACCINPTDL